MIVVLRHFLRCVLVYGSVDSQLLLHTSMSIATSDCLRNFLRNGGLLTIRNFDRSAEHLWSPTCSLGLATRVAFVTRRSCTSMILLQEATITQRDVASDVIFCCSWSPSLLLLILLLLLLLMVVASIIWEHLRCTGHSSWSISYVLQNANNKTFCLYKQQNVWPRWPTWYVKVEIL